MADSGETPPGSAATDGQNESEAVNVSVSPVTSEGKENEADAVETGKAADDDGKDDEAVGGGLVIMGGPFSGTDPAERGGPGPGPGPGRGRQPWGRRPDSYHHRDNYHHRDDYNRDRYGGYHRGGRDDGYYRGGRDDGYYRGGRDDGYYRGGRDDGGYYRGRGGGRGWSSGRGGGGGRGWSGGGGRGYRKPWPSHHSHPDAKPSIDTKITVGGESVPAGSNPPPVQPPSSGGYATSYYQKMKS